MNKIPISFPVAVCSTSEDYTSYYFAGDFVYIDAVSYIYWLKGYDFYKKWAPYTQDEFENKGFFWHKFSPRKTNNI